MVDVGLGWQRATSDEPELTGGSRLVASSREKNEVSSRAILEKPLQLKKRAEKIRWLVS